MLKRHLATVFCAALLLSFKPALALGAEEIKGEALDGFWNGLERTLGRVETLVVNFTQTRHVELFAEDLTAGGMTIFEAPDHIRHEIVAPFQTVLISNGQELARYERVAKDKPWHKLTGAAVSAMGQVTAQIALWLRGNIRFSQKQYELSVFKNGESYQIKMVPKNKNMRKNISWIELQIPADFSQVASVTMHEAGGDYTKISYEKPRAKAKISPELFQISKAEPAPLPEW